MGIKKFWQSLDLRNNKLIRAKTDMPEHEDQIVPKKYVDEQTVYNTPKVQQFLEPFKLRWVTEPANKTLLELFDDVFFPLIQPLYYNPEVSEFKVEKINYNGKYFFNGTTFDIAFRFKILNNDRFSSALPYLYIEYIDEDTDIIELDSSDYEQLVTKTISVTKQIAIFELRWVFNPTTIIKEDSYSNEVPLTDIDANFKVNFTLQHNILNAINKISTIWNVPIMYKPIIDTEEFDDFEEIDYSIDDLITEGFIKTQETLLLPANRNFIILCIPIIFFDTDNITINDVHVNLNMYQEVKLIEIDDVYHYALLANIGTFDTAYFTSIKIK